MFSFFRGKKHSPRSSPEPEDQPPIPGPDSDYVIVSDKSKSDSKDGTPSSSSGYPSFNQFGIPNAGNMMNTNNNNNNNNNNRQRQDIPVHYLHGVPFKLSSDLMIGDTTEVSRIQVDEILVNITRKLQLENDDYNFKQERNTISS